MGTRKISQLDTISDANLSGEAILPVVVSDPLIPNRKAKINQLFKGVAQGTKAAPGLCFDLDRDTGLYQAAYDQVGLAFGNGGLYFTRIDNGNSSVSLYATAVDDVANNADIVLSPKGTGAVKVTGQFVMADGDFILEDSQGPKARFEVSNVGTGTNTRIFTLPAITSGNGTTVVGDNTSQTLTNKTLLIDEDNLVIIDGDQEAIFQIAWTETQNARRSYFLPDAGTVTTTTEPTATSSTLIDTKTEQTLLSKSFVNIKLVANSEVGTNWAQFNTDALDGNRTITMPNQNITLVGTDATQVLQNKSIETLVLQDPTDNTKKISFSTANQNTISNEVFEFPLTDLLNTGIGENNVFVSEKATQDVYNKTLYTPTVKNVGNLTGSVVIQTDNLTAARTIRFPDADATLLSTENVTADDVNFGAGIGAANLTGRTRQQQFFYAGF
ncbi:structural protein [Synechococcus phage S-RS29]|nr:structural protein [Synechococcus phage S-RS29]